MQVSVKTSCYYMCSVVALVATAAVAILFGVLSF